MRVSFTNHLLTKEFTAWNNEFKVAQMYIRLSLYSPVLEQRGSVFVEKCPCIVWNSNVVVLYVKNFRLFKGKFHRYYNFNKN